MSTRKPHHRRSRGRYQPRPNWTAAARALPAEQLPELWAAYIADRGNLPLRNRLVEHYLPAVVENGHVVGQRAAPPRPGETPSPRCCSPWLRPSCRVTTAKAASTRWAYVCAKRKLIDLRRAQRRTARVFAKEPAGSVKLALLDEIPDREAYCGQGDIRPDYRRIERSAGGGPLAAGLLRPVGQSGRAGVEAFAP